VTGLGSLPRRSGERIRPPVATPDRGPRLTAPRHRSFGSGTVTHGRFASTILSDVFTIAQARHMIATLRPRIDELITLRANLAELRADLASGGASPFGGLPEVKGLEARIHSIIDELNEHDIQVKGIAPLLLDFVGERDGRPVLWCWLEGTKTSGGTTARTAGSLAGAESELCCWPRLCLGGFARWGAAR
jgi:hypothetical protein